MAKNQYKVIATLGQSVGFEVYKADGQGFPRLQESRKVTIGGGANIYDALGRSVPAAVETLVSESELEQLEENPTFKAFKAGGFIQVVKVQEDSEKVVDAMTAKDNSSQRTAQDVENDNKTSRVKANVANKNGEIVVEMNSQEYRDKVVVATKQKQKASKVKKSK